MWELSSFSEAAMGSLRCTCQTEWSASQASQLPQLTFIPMWELSSFSEAAMGPLRCTCQTEWSASQASQPTVDLIPMWELSSFSEAAMGSLRYTCQTERPASRASPAPTGKCIQCGSCRALARLRWDRCGVPVRPSGLHCGQARLPQENAFQVRGRHASMMAIALAVLAR